MESPLAGKGKEGEERRGKGRGKGEKGTGGEKRRRNKRERGEEGKRRESIKDKEKNENSIKGQQFCLPHNLPDLADLVIPHTVIQ